MTHVWHLRLWLGERKGQKCRIVAGPSRMGTILIEFEDGYRAVTDRRAVRRIR